MNLAYPFSLISGKGLGISYSSFTQIGAALPSRDFGQLKIQSFVNVNTGNLILFDHKLVLPEKNFPVELYYVYNSQAQTVSGIWRLAHKYFKTIPVSTTTPMASLAILVEEDGHETSYHLDDKSGLWVPPLWSDSRPYLYHDASAKQWQWFDAKTQITEIYNEYGYLIQRLDSKNEATTYSYDKTQTPWQLSAIEGPSRTRYEIRRQQLPDGRHSESIYQIYIEKPTLLRYSEFDMDGRLTQTTIVLKNPDQSQWPRVDYKYRFPSKNRDKLSDPDVYWLAYLEEVMQSDGDCLSFVYGITSNYVPMPIARFSYQKPTDIGIVLANFSYARGNTVIQNYAKVSTKLYFNKEGSITQIDREQGYALVPGSGQSDSRYYTYYENGQLASITSPGQGKQSFQYSDVDGLLIKQQKANGQITEYCYDQSSIRHNLLTQINYVNGKAQVTRKVYDQAYGESGNGLYLRFAISPEGRVSEYRFGEGNFIQYTILYLEGRFPVDRYSKNVAPSLAEMALWVAQQNPQQVSLSKRLYDHSGQLSYTYRYATIDKKGEGISDDRTSELFTVYSIFGDLRFHSESRETGKSKLKTLREFDNLRRLMSFQNAAEEITSYHYGNRRIEIIRPNGRNELTEFDTRGWICKEQQTIQINNQSVTREITYSRNIVGCATEKRTTADGQFSYQFYDKQNRLGFIVHPNGCLTEYRYDAQNCYKATIRYAKKIDKEKLIAGRLPWNEPSANDLFRLMENMAIADPLHDRISYEFYDTSERLYYAVDEEAYICQTIYNDHDQVIAQIKHEARLQPDQLAALLKGKNIVLPIEPTRDRIQCTFYDGEQQIIGLQDAAGYVTEYKRNGAHWVTEIIRYAQCQTISINADNFEKIRPAASPDDAHEYHFYDPRGWMVLTVDAEGYICTKDYLLNGLVHSEKHYATAVDAAWYSNTQILPPLPADSPEDQIINYEYDALNREIESRRSDGKVTFTRYDNMGNIIVQGVRDALTPEITGDTYRASEYRFDGWGQTIAEAATWNSESLARIDTDSTLTPEEKQNQKEKIWKEHTKRHVYDASGLKLSTAVRSSSDATDQLTYYYYDSERHLVLTIQVIAAKQVTLCEYSRDIFNNIIQVRDYSQIQASLSEKYHEPLTGGFLPESLRKALDALQDDTHDVITQKAYNKRDELIKMTDAEGYETQHIPNAFSEVSQGSLPVQTKQPTLIIQHQYDARGLEISTQRQADTLNIKVKHDYSNLYGKLTHTRDALKGDYQRGYDRKGRLIWRQNPLQQQRSNIAYDAWDKPSKITNALGQTTQHLYQQSKRTQTIIDPLGNQRTLVQNVFAEKIAETDANQQTQTWQHAPDGQINRYSDALGRGYLHYYNLLGYLTAQQILNGSKTCYLYNAIGNCIAKIEDAEGYQRQTQYQYNLLGQCINTTDARGIVQENNYDRRALVIQQSFDPNQGTQTGLALTTTRDYNGQGKLIRETIGDAQVADQYTRTLEYDGLNRHCVTTIDPLTATRKEALNIETQRHKNARDMTIAEIDANGHVTRFIVDAAGRRCFQINALWGVSEWKYNEADQIILERQYQQPIAENNVTQINDETTPEQLRAMLQPHAEDSLTYRYYDANGNQRFTVACCAQQGYVQEKRYDAVQREIQTIQYATAIDIQSLEQLTTEQLAKQLIKIADASQDRINYFLRDEVGQLRFSIDPKKYIHEQRFDEQGCLIFQVSYANPVVDPTQLIKLPLAHVLSYIKKDDSQDRYQLFFFDSLGQPLYTINPEGQVVSYQHDAKGNLIEEVHFKQRLVIPQDYAQLLLQLNVLKPDPSQDRITRKTYDAANRLIQQTDALGYVEFYQYDALANRITYSDRQQSPWKTLFDRAKRPIVEITPTIPITQVMQDASGLLVATSLIVAIEKHKFYDKVGNISRMITAANTSEPRIFAAEYNGLNQWQMTHLPEIAIDNASALQPDDWRYRPETKQTLTTYRTTNAKGLKVAEQDPAGQWRFWVYDEQKQLIYQVKPLGITTKKERDAFGKICRKITYATPCALDLSVYSGTGIPKSILDDYYRKRHMESDRIINYQRDQQGRIILQRQGPVYCYTTNLQPGSHAPAGTISEENTEISKSYNAWGQLIAQTEKIDATRKKEKFYWFDRNGHCVAEADTVGLDKQTPQYRCTRYERDSFGQMIRRHAYAKPLDAAINAHWAFVDFSHAIDQIISTADRCEQFYYDLAGRLLKKIREQVVYQTLQLTNGLPTFNDTSRQDISVTYQYNANGQVIAKTLEDGSIEWSYYDKRGFRLAQTDVPRNNQGLSSIIVPLTYYGNNAHGQIVLTTRFKQGTKPVIVDSFPQPLALDPSDQQEKKLFDARGKLQWKQNNQKTPTGFSYTANGKLARQWWSLTNWRQKEGNQYEYQTHIDEKYFQYDAQNRAISVEVRRDTQVIETTCTHYDAFDQSIREGEKPESMSIYRRFDQLGRLWSSNAEGGTPTLYLHDLMGQCALRMQSAAKDLSFITYEEIPNLLSWDITELERVENQRDLAGRAIIRTLPANYQIDNSQAQIIPLSLLASKLYPSLGKIQSLSWPIPQEQNVQAEFTLWPQDLPLLKQTLAIVTQEGRCGVDVSQCATDVYNYQISYYFTGGTDRKITNEPKRLLYTSSGIMQFETNSTTQSQHLVVLSEQEQESIVRLTGNTRDITRVELWQDKEKRATLALQLDPKTHGYYVDLSHYASGVYQLKPQKPDKTEQLWSLPFTIYTDKPASKPLSREITSALSFRFLANHGEINWQVPNFLQSQIVKLQCHYVDSEDKKQLQACNLSPTEKRTTYVDKKGNKIQSNVDFANPIKAIEMLSLAVRWPLTANKLSSVLTRLEHHWLLLAPSHEPSSDEDDAWEIIPNAFKAVDAEQDEWIPLYCDESPLAPSSAAPSFDPELIDELQFCDKRLVMVSPVPDLKGLKETPTLEYLDVSLDRMRCWKQFKTISVTSQGFVVDVTGFTAGVYPFRCNEHSGNLVITLGGQVFPSPSTIEPDRQHLVQPARRYSYDLWNNRLSETDSLGHTTQFIYNDADQLMQKQEPAVEVVDEQGIAKTVCPVTTFAYDARGILIGTRDAHGNTCGFIVDAAGHCIIELLADGTKRKTQLFDALNNVYEARDAAGQVTQYHYDTQNNLLEYQRPSSSRLCYSYNELKQRTSDTDPAGNTRRYNFDALGNVSERYEPLGQCTHMLYGRHRQLREVKNPDGSQLSWERDAFGKALQHTDLSGAVYRYQYDTKGQLIEVSSQGGNHGQYVKIEPTTMQFSNTKMDGYKTVLGPVPGQQLKYQYISGRVIQLADLAGGKTTYYSYDSEGRRIGIRVVSKEGELLREISAQNDALGREVITYDNKAVFTTAYDAVSNRRYIKAVVKPGAGKAQQNQEVWWKYDTQDRVILAEGIFEKGQIKLTPNQGSQFAYQDDRRVTETQLNKSGNVVTATLQYDIDGRLTGSVYSTGERTQRQYHPAGWQTSYKDIRPRPFQAKEIVHIQHDEVYNENSWLTASVQKIDEGRPIQTDYQDLTALGLPQQQTIHYNDENATEDHLQYTYVGWDAWQVANIQGYRINRYGRSGYSSAKHFIGPNGEQNALFGAQGNNSTSMQNRYFEATPDGLVLRRMNLLTVLFVPAPHPVVLGRETYYFYRVNGQYLGSYDIGHYDRRRTQTFLWLNWVRHGQRNGAGRELGILHGNSPGRAISFDPLVGDHGPRLFSPYGKDDYFTSLPQTYTSVAGDSYAVIAEKLYGDASLASYIEAANGGVELIAGQTLVVPRLIVVHNKAGMARPYYQLLQIIQGSLIPHLDTPQPQQHHSFWGTLLKVVVVAIVCIEAPYLAVGIAGALGVSTVVVTAVMVALGDAAAQGLCIGLGIEQHFSLAEMLSASITAGFASAFSPALSGGLTAEQTMQYMLRVGMVNVAEQLTEMAIGIRHQFDLSGVALAMGTAGLNSKMGQVENPWLQRGINDFNATVLSGVVRGQFDVENLAMQLIADEASLAVQHMQVKPSVSDIYRQTQEASRGTGKVVQTIEQQWQSQLINDAEFTAHLSLPSVTFDVNDSRIAQQLGQRVAAEVSRFQHTTPARNPNGFWQRATQSVENAAHDILEHRALIAEGRAAAYSKVMRASLEYDAANQQTYLDIGYSDSIAQTRAARWAASELPIPSVAKFSKTAIKMSRLLDEDKWWFLRQTESEKMAVRFRTEQMLEKNTGYNVSPESWFKAHPQIGEYHTYLTDYRAISEVLGPIQSNTKVGVSLFPLGNKISIVKALQLEYQLGLKYRSLYDRGKGFRFSQIVNISEKFPRSPIKEKNAFFRGASRGLPGGGPELAIESRTTKSWPWN
jgi:YD repeat-containing protein